MGSQENIEGSTYVEPQSWTRDWEVAESPAAAVDVGHTADRITPELSPDVEAVNLGKTVHKAILWDS